MKATEREVRTQGRTRFRLQVSALLLTLVVALALAGCAQALSVKRGYPFKEIPYGGAPLVWMDNESVLFTGNRRTSASESSKRATGGPIALFRWNTRTDKVIELMRAGPSPDLCYDRGYIYVAFNRNGHRVLRQGPLGGEQETVIEKRQAPPVKGELNRHTCRWQQIPKPTRADHGVVEMLRDDHGHVEAERPSEPFAQRRYFLVRPTGEVVSTSLRAAGGRTTFSEFAKGYVFQDGGGLMADNVERHLQVLGLDGRVSVYRLPPGQWMRGTVYGMPVRGATLMVSLSKVGGAYLVKDSRVERIVEGYINRYTVSPDGCKVAMYVRPAEDLVSRLAVVNVCKGES